jgi:threonine/homoserine/homoserine lactone efflux protein
MTLEALRAFLFGVAIAAPVGPIALLLIHTGLNHRLSAALSAALGVALADFTYALLALATGAGLVRLLHAHQRAFQLASSGLLIVLGLWLATRALRERVMPTAGAEPTTRAPGLIQLYLLTLANPLTILLFAAFSGQMSVHGGVGAVLYGSLCLFLGSLAVQTGYASFGAALRRWVTTPSAVRKINAMSGVAIAAFGAWGIGSVIGG